jgi:hypothetical protein
LTNPADNRIDLFVGQHAARALRKSGHGRRRNSAGGRVTQGRVVCDRKVYGIGERDRSSAVSLCAMTARAVLLVEGAKI